MSKREPLSVSMPKLIMSVTLIVMLGAFLGILYYFAANVSKLNPSIDEDICNVGKGDVGFGGIKGIFTKSSPNYSEIKSSCEQKTECKWKGLGGKAKMNYACCPKDLSIMMKVYERCGLRID